MEKRNLEKSDARVEEKEETAVQVRPRNREPSRRCGAPPRRTARREKSGESSAFLLFLVLTHSLTPPMETPKSSVRTLFDPMVGEFCADFDITRLKAFLEPKLRYRNDAALAHFAYKSMPQETTVNMLMVSSQHMNPMRGQAQPADPSLLDYDAIDASWRRDIELEKGIGALDTSGYNGCTDQGCSSSGLDTASDQFQRDLQILTQKSVLGTLSTEETFQYEDLAKAQFADFYHQIPNVQKTKSRTPEWLSPTNMAKALGDLQDPSECFNNLKDTPHSSSYSDLTLCQEQNMLVNDVNLGVEREVSDVEEEELPEEFKDFDTSTSLNLSWSETSQVLNDEQVRADLGDAYWLHEFEGMEMLGEFQNYFNEDEEDSESRESSPVPDVGRVEEVHQCEMERDMTPSSGIGSMRSSGSSPSQNDEVGVSDIENRHYLHSRVYNKLAPMVRHSHSSVSSESSFDFDTVRFGKNRLNSMFGPSSIPRPLSAQNGGIQQRKRGRQSKDEQLAMENALPASAEEFAAMTHMEIQRFMRDPSLTPQQKALIKKIRRRGRNKVAARKCRERRTADGPMENEVQPSTSSNSLLNDPSNLSLFDY
ncbi:unnamed protein product [Bursaphelenchus xylophilus]|uniref:(pine wood nematode) hypothetical protein n=1 Tax=Bursaphelenchus xylophilus TaxID=6326 RepID=A0A1I7RHK4_BURXY|nr:unnamed protein product [Bursaphelenchus xylophilus]CAG9115647.1 unnamed protein product [Bursaphelenchus xylophilus]